jgi:hypothetical protein
VYFVVIFFIFYRKGRAKVFCKGSKGFFCYVKFVIFILHFLAPKSPEGDFAALPDSPLGAGGYILNS